MKDVAVRFRSSLALSLVVGGVLAVAVPSASYAATDNATLPVSAQVAAAASLTTTPLQFGNYTGASVQSTALLTVTATAGTTYTVGLGSGLYGSSVNARRMQSMDGASTLAYNVYKDSARSNVWTDGGTGLVQATGTGVQQNLTAYGAIPPFQTATVGSYTDALVATVTF